MAEMILTLFDLDNPVEPTQICTCCKRNLPNTAFYLESESKRKYPGQLRKHCKECWKKTNGKTAENINKLSRSLFTIENETDNSFVTNLIKNEGIYYASLTYNTKNKSFNVNRDHSYNKQAVYFIVEENEENFLIHKVGMASGARGLDGRYSKYSGNHNSKLENCYMTQNINKAMRNKKLRGKVLKVYYLPNVAESEVELYGRKCKSTAVRDLERTLAIECKEQGHPMLLASQN